MTLLGTFAGIAALIAPVQVTGQLPQPPAKAGDVFEITKSYQTENLGSDGSSASSSGHSSIVERVIVASPTGLELEYDLPAGSTAADRAREWTFPARIFKPFSGPMQLLNRGELEVRLGEWLNAANWTRDICGRWIFTWNAFKIECDPELVLETIATFDLRSVDLRAGSAYRDGDALDDGVLKQVGDGSDGATYTATMKVDPDAVRRARGDRRCSGSDCRQTSHARTSAGKRAEETISGTILVTFKADPSGLVAERVRVMKLETRRPDGSFETDTKTETLRRKSLEAATPGSAQ